uniref:DOG1 domain-containing protein n=1 Tax=Leersia perrieri TaxID=77586 RepID=A0A0D9UX16_9ORYZ
MAPPPPSPHINGNNLPAPSGETFAKFFECWISEQSRDLAALRSAAAASNPPPPEPDLRRLVDRVLGHYEYYYRTKSAAASHDVLRMFSPSWTSTTENLYLWCGGWRPTAAIHLLYSKSGAQLEAHLPLFLAGGGLGSDSDLGDLSADQLQAADQLQRSTILKEREIDNAAASAQESLATAKMVELAGGGGLDGEGMEMEMKAKEDGMKRVLEMADGLRMETMRAVVALLRPSQAVHFLIAAAELHLAVHEFGRRKDGAASPQQPPS